MSAAYFIVLDSKEVDFDSSVGGKAIAHVFDELDEFCKKHGLERIENFHSQGLGEFIEELDDIEMLEEEVIWFDAQEGIDWAKSLIEKIKVEKPSFESDSLIEDLEEYLVVFKNTKEADAKWHLELDF